MKDAAGIQISTENNPDMGRVAQVMRTMAATSAETAALTFLMTPGLARKIAHHLDGGGFYAARQAEQAIAAAQAQIERQVEAEDRAAWIEKCQSMLGNARRGNRRAFGFLAATLLMWLLLPVLLLIWL